MTASGSRDMLADLFDHVQGSIRDAFAMKTAKSWVAPIDWDRRETSPLTLERTDALICGHL